MALLEAHVQKMRSPEDIYNSSLNRRKLGFTAGVVAYIFLAYGAYLHFRTADASGDDDGDTFLAWVVLFVVSNFVPV